MSGKCWVCGAPCDGDVCDWQCAEQARAMERSIVDRIVAHYARMMADRTDRIVRAKATADRAFLESIGVRWEADI